MAAIQNQRDRILQDAAQRVVQVDPPNSVVVTGYTGISLAKNPSIFIGSVSTGQVEPTFIEIRATLKGIPATHTVNWSIDKWQLTDTPDPLVKLIESKYVNKFNAGTATITASVDYANQIFTGTIQVMAGFM